MLWFKLDPAESENCFVYFIRGRRGLIKIGRSYQPRRRVLEHRSRYSDVDVLLVYEAPVSEETRLHRRFLHHRAHNEWFFPVPDLTNYIEGFSRDVPRYQNGAAWHPEGHFVRGEFTSLKAMKDRVRLPPDDATIHRLVKPLPRVST